jgi:hypothetical protein
VFKELGLSQDQATKLVEFQAKLAEQQLASVKAMDDKWIDQINKDPEIGTKLATVKADIGRALDALNDAKLVSEFKDAMNLTRAGNNPAFVKAFWKLSQLVTEGKPVPGGRPSPLGQNPTGQKQIPSAAAAMYPHLAN